MVLPAHNAVRLRDKYTPRACNECQRRKRRCSGEKICRTCQISGTECIYSAPQGSKTWRASDVSDASAHWLNWDNGKSASNVSTKVVGRGNIPSSEGGARTHLFQPLNTSKDATQTMERATATPQTAQRALPPVPSPLAPCLVDDSCQTSHSALDTEVPSTRESVFERNTNFMTGAAFFQQIDALDRSVTRTQSTKITRVGVTWLTTLHPNVTWADIYRDIDQTVEEAQAEDATKILTALDIFFATVQPHYPCINEVHLRAQFAAFIAKDSSSLTKNSSVQLAALLNYIIAVVKILANVSADDDHLPGWDEFCKGERLLSNTTWLEKANIVTIQTLLVKTLYFTYAALLNSAYDTMGTAVRLCFQLGLHNESSWGNDCKFYDLTYRQRVLWSVFCLNHNVAQIRGVPELLRESDLNVGLPKCVDDRILYPGCPNLPEMPRASFVPYLLEIIKLTRLSSEAWEAMFGVRAKKPVSQDIIAALDYKIMDLSQAIPPYLRWSPNFQQIHEGAPAFIQQQAFVLHLRILQLRILLRREEMISLSYDKKTAQLCTDLATEIVAAVEAFDTTHQRNRCSRHAYLHHLTGAVVAMICIIVTQNNGEDLTRPAVNVLNKSLKIMESFSPGSFLARRILQQLRRPIQAAREVMLSQTSQTVRSNAPMKALASMAAPAQNASWSGNNIDNNNDISRTNHHDWALPLANAYADPFQDVQQEAPQMPFLWDDTDTDLWNTFPWAG